MTNEDMRAALKRARTYNRTTKASQSWSNKVDKMKVEQVFEVFNRFDRCLHVYLVPCQLDGYPLGIYDTSKQWSYEKAMYGSYKAREKVEAELIAEHPEFANTKIHYLWAEELPYKDTITLEVICNNIPAFRLISLASYKNIRAEEVRPNIVRFTGDTYAIAELLINNGLKPDNSGLYQIQNHVQLEL